MCRPSARPLPSSCLAPLVPRACSCRRLACRLAGSRRPGLGPLPLPLSLSLSLHSPTRPTTPRSSLSLFTHLPQSSFPQSSFPQSSLQSSLSCASQAPTKTPSLYAQARLPTRPRKNSLRFPSWAGFATVTWKFPPPLSLYQPGLTFLHHSSTPPRSGNEGVSPGTEGNRREKKGGKTRAYCRCLSPRLHPSLGERLLPHGARSMASAVDVALV